MSDFKVTYKGVEAPEYMVEAIRNSVGIQSLILGFQIGVDEAQAREAGPRPSVSEPKFRYFCDMDGDASWYLRFRRGEAATRDKYRSYRREDGWVTEAEFDLEAVSRFGGWSEVTEAHMREIGAPVEQDV